MGLLNNDSKTKTVDFSQVKDNFEPLPEGIYNAEITGVEEKESSTGNPMYVWEIEVDNKDGGTAKVKDFMSLTEAALWRLKELVLATGIATKEDLKGSYDFDPNEVMEIPIKVQLEVSEYNGYRNNKVKHFLKSDSDKQGLV
jgi:hypothetical protein